MLTGVCGIAYESGVLSSCACCDSADIWPKILVEAKLKFFFARISSNTGSALFKAGISCPWRRTSIVWLIEMRAMYRTSSVSA